MPISAEYDREADALYVRLHDGARHRAVEINDTIYVDVDDSGRAVGIELLYPTLGLDLEGVAQQFDLHAHLPEIIGAIAATDAPVIDRTATGGQHLASTITVVTRFEGTVVAGGPALAGSVSQGDASSPLVGCSA